MQQDDYLIQKKPFGALFAFSLPIIIGNLFQQTYTMADSAIVGRYVGAQALAAVGASGSLTNIFIFIAFGGGVGASVVVSRCFGAVELNRMKRAVLTAFITFLALSLLFALTGLLFGRQIMILMNTPPDVLDMAVEYLNIYFLGLPFLFMYNILSSMFNALGKSKIPLYFLIFSSLFNIGLDLVMVRRFHMGVSGAAWATLIAQGISAVLSFAVFMRLLRRLNCGRARIFDLGELREMTRIALPSILQQSTVSIGMMLLQSIVNGFGSQALAGFSAGARVESFCVVPMQAVGSAFSSFAAQNIGAEKKDRIPEGYRASVKMVIGYAVIICVILECFHEPIIRFFLGENGTTEAIKTGSDYITFLGWFFCLLGFKMTADAVLRGAGDMKMFTIANLVNLSSRVILSTLLAPVAGIGMVWYTEPLGWSLNLLISWLEYRTGKWRKL